MVNMMGNPGQLSKGPGLPVHFRNGRIVYPRGNSLTVTFFAVSSFISKSAAFDASLSDRISLARMPVTARVSYERRFACYSRSLNCQSRFTARRHFSYIEFITRVRVAFGAIHAIGTRIVAQCAAAAFTGFPVIESHVL